MRAKRTATLMVAAALAGALPAAPAHAATVASASRGTAAGASTSVIVRGIAGSGPAVAAAAVRSVGGTVTRELGIIDGVSATLPPGAAAALAARPEILSVIPDTTGHVMSVDPVLGYDPADTGSLASITTLVGARAMWSKGFTGKGVDVAVIDTGVAPVAGLTGGNVINGPDLSFDSQTTATRYLDGYGHGTHMASIIAARDAAGTPSSYAASGSFAGVAPDSRVVSIKVGAADGSADVSQVIAAIDWVTRHAHDSGLNIRVLNLSYGTDATQDYRVDPLAYAAEAAWRKGILVVVAAGNDGTSKVNLANPAQDPTLLAVGAEDPQGTLTTVDDTIPDFSNRGTSQRHVDVVAPGTHVLGLRAPGSAVDISFPAARVGTRFMRGSGTSQATAVVSGAAALLLSAHPSLTPDQVKGLLSLTATPLPKGTVKNMGAGLVDVAAANTLVVGMTLEQLLKLSVLPAYGTGTGSLELARGSSHVTHNSVTLVGERNIVGRAWDPAVWAPAALRGTAWTSTNTTESWSGSAWNSAGWVTSSGTTTTTPPTLTASTTAAGWGGLSWKDAAWSGERWASSAWVTGWDGRSWVTGIWEGRSWVSSTWSSSSWN